MNEIDDLLGSLLNSYKPGPVSLRDLFEHRLTELEISQRQALIILDIEVRALNSVLDGAKKKVDFEILLKLSQFLNKDVTEVVRLYLEVLNDDSTKNIGDSEKRNFIQHNFDLINLRKCGIIDSINDFDEIEKRICGLFGYDNIYEYKKDRVVPAFSTGKVIPKSTNMRDFWVEGAYTQLKKINNTNPYELEALIEYFPTIRWHSMHVAEGLLQVTRSLFKLGITLIYQPYLPTIHARGATFAVNGKPCIVLTDYRGFYPTLWFALIHELHHVIFDWEEIQLNSYHISGEPDIFTMKENEANKFAKDYLFPDQKMKEVLPEIDNEYFVENFAKNNHIHPSIIYAFHCFNAEASDKLIWARYKKFMPDIKLCLKSLEDNPWQKPIKDLVKIRQEKVFNTIKP